MKFRFRLGLIASVVVLLAACGGGADPTPTPTGTPTPTVPAAGGFDAEWQQLEEAAKAEGEMKLFVCCGFGADIEEVLLPAFEQRFGIDVINSAGSSSQNAERVLAERQGGIYDLDLWIGGPSTSLTTLKPAGALQTLEPLLVHPEVLDTSVWFEDRLAWIDANDKYVLAFGGSIRGADIGYNTQLVNPTEIQSYEDLLDPKWKGKIVARDPRVPGCGCTDQYFHPGVGKEWYERLLTEMDVLFTDNPRQGVELVASGARSLALFGFQDDLIAAKEQGLPVEVDLPHQLESGLIIFASGYTMYQLDSNPNPNATKLFANWFLTKEGQTLFQQVTGFDSLRTDIPKDDVNPAERRPDNLQPNDYLFLDINEAINEQEVYDWATSILGPR